MDKRKRTLPRGWYPFDGEDCERDIRSFLAGWAPHTEASAARFGGVVPHAGWFFSGKIAARVMRTVSREKVQLVVLFGGHLGPNDQPRIVLEEICETPLGEIKTDKEFAEKLAKKVGAKREALSSGDNTLEIQMPMIKYFFPDARLVALRSPLSETAIRVGEEVAEMAKRDGVSIVVIGSTDLTHYGPNYGQVSKGVGPQSVEWVKTENDQRFIAEVLAMNPEALLRHAADHESACSAGAAASAVAAGKALGAEKGILLDYYTSYDILPDDSFVGYAGIVF
jgi:MEMO1 family protein